MQRVQTQSSKVAERSIVGLIWLALVALVTAVAAQDAYLAGSGLSVAIGLLTIFVAATVATFSLRYMRSDPQSRRFFLTLGALVIAVLAFLFTGNLLVFALAWTASGVLLAKLIGHQANWVEADLAARRTRRAFLLGDAALLGALALLGWQAGSVQIGEIGARAATLPPLTINLAAVLLVIAAAARCALPPFSSWLLSSMTAPTPVSALMHAGFVNAGGFLLIRFAPILEAAPAARFAAVTLGLFAAIYGIGISMVRPDVKRALAGSTISQMGFMIMSCGLGAYAAALWHIVAHGLFKAWLFLGSGSTIGIKPDKSAAILSGRAALLIAAGTAGLALSLFSFGAGEASLIPLLLGVATAAATLIAALGGKLAVRAKAGLAFVIVALMAFHGVGLALAGMALGLDAAPILPDGALVALLMVFLAAWAWQQQRLVSGRGLPLPLYVHFINAGALPVIRKGDDK